MSKQIALAILLALGAANLGMIDSAQAQSPEEQQACTNDAFQFCQAAIPDRDKVFTCLASNRNQISPACRAVMAQYLPGETKRQASAPAREKAAKTKGPINIAPH
jgi:hypothetical protein